MSFHDAKNLIEPTKRSLSNPSYFRLISELQIPFKIYFDLLKNKVINKTIFFKQ